ncbi:Myc [Carabus blaptoides fortunei]
MPVRSDDTVWPCEAHFFDEFESIRSDDLLSMASFPSDDIWKKFEFCDLPLSEITDSSSSSMSAEEDLELDAVLEWTLDATTRGNAKDISEIRHHDCMWAGHCGSKEHKPETMKTPRPLQQTPACTPVTVNSPSVPKKQQSPVQHSAQAGRSLLLNSRNINNNNSSGVSVTNILSSTTQTRVAHSTVLAPAALGNVGPRPDSPPSSDDDDQAPRFKHELTLFDQAESKTLQLLNDAISECDFDEDSDLCDYFEDSDMFAGTESKETPRAYPGESDHSYHKGKGPQLRTDHLGVQTPSDSEEEIDVVSVGDKQMTNARNCSTVLPTNPSMRDRQKLQRTVASAISGKREFNQPLTGGIKTRLPLRLPNTIINTTSSNTERISLKKRNPANDGRRGVKRARHHRYQKSSPSSSPAKKRGYGNSSDSETECSEKRSLHNNMERQRRVDLRNAFDDLRVLVPEVSGKERAAKVVILREAASYCEQLTNESANYTKQVSELRKQQERLRARVSQLRRSLAAKR